MSKFDIRHYDEDASTKETRKDQKIKHQLYDKRTGRIAATKKGSNRVQKVRWSEDGEA